MDQAEACRGSFVVARFKTEIAVSRSFRAIAICPRYKSDAESFGLAFTAALKDLLCVFKLAGFEFSQTPVIKKLCVRSRAGPRCNLDQQRQCQIEFFCQRVTFSQRVDGVRIFRTGFALQFERLLKIAARVVVLLQIELGKAGQLPGLGIRGIGGGDCLRFLSRLRVLVLLKKLERVGRVRARRRRRVVFVSPYLTRSWPAGASPTGLPARTSSNGAFRFTVGDRLRRRAQQCVGRRCRCRSHAPRPGRLRPQRGRVPSTSTDAANRVSAILSKAWGFDYSLDGFFQISSRIYKSCSANRQGLRFNLIGKRQRRYFGCRYLISGSPDLAKVDTLAAVARDSPLVH